MYIIVFWLDLIGDVEQKSLLSWDLKPLQSITSFADTLPFKGTVTPMKRKGTFPVIYWVNSSLWAGESDSNGLSCQRLLKNVLLSDHFQTSSCLTVTDGPCEQSAGFIETRIFKMRNTWTVFSPARGSEHLI